MKILGAIIAGGHSTRFSGDKAAAMLHGKPLVEHVADGLRPQTSAIIICGRAWKDFDHIADHPAPEMGPLGGLCAALRYGSAHGFDAVMTASCDVLPVPIIAAAANGSRIACYITGHYLAGHWPAAMAQDLESYLQQADTLSVRRWLDVAGAQAMPCPQLLHNLNSRAAFDSYAAQSQ
jgi:molybdenum cofactor guanylyltransferase